jgi:hypothetical protein
MVLISSLQGSLQGAKSVPSINDCALSLSMFSTMFDDWTDILGSFVVVVSQHDKMW